MPKIVLFVWSVLKEWKRALITPGIMTVLAIAQKVLAFDVPEFVYWILLCLTLFLAFFFAWKRQYEKGTLIPLVLLAESAQQLLRFINELTNTHEKKEVLYPLKSSSIPDAGKPHSYIHKELIRFQHEFSLHQIKAKSRKHQISIVGQNCFEIRESIENYIEKLWRDIEKIDSSARTTFLEHDPSS